MTKLRNGKELAEAILEFRKDKEPTEKKFGKYDYFKIEEYIELLDQCFGADGYSVSYSDAGTVTVSPTQVVFLVKATVSVYGEDGSVAYTFEGYGTHEPTRDSKVEDKAINLETLGMVGCVNALKSACTQLGCFGMRNMTEDGKKSSYRPAGASSSARGTSGRQQAPERAQAQTQAAPQAEDEEKSFYVCDGAKEGGTDKNGKMIFILPCHEIVDGKPVEKASEIIFYETFYKEPGRLSKLTKWNGIPAKIRFKVRKIDAQQQKNKDAYSAYTFRGFCNAR